MKNKMELLNRIHKDHEAMTVSLDLLVSPHHPNKADIISNLVDHITDHFRDEETCMRMYGYPNMDSHLQFHEDILNKFVSMLVKEVPVEYQDEELMDLKQKILNHILTDDEDLVRFIVTKE